MGIPLVSAAVLMIGTATCDITPPKPAALDGQMFTRMSTEVLTPITANIIAMESREGDKSPAYCVIVSMDLVGVRPEIDAAIRAAVKKALPDFDVTHLILSATHTHTAPVALTDYYVPATADCMRPAEFVRRAADTIASGVAEAWNRRAEAQFSYGLGHAVVAYNRRIVYADGSVKMYGETDDTTFRGVEGAEDHDVNTMFFWDKSDRLLAMIVNLSCPSQEVESLTRIHADFWHPTRRMLKNRFGKGVCVVPLCGAAGDVSPHTQYRRAAEERMTSLRGLTRLDEIARRITRGVEETYEPAKAAKTSNVALKHEYAVLSLPQRRVTEAEYNQARAEAERLKKVIETDPYQTPAYQWHKGVMARYEAQQKDPKASSDVPIHILRIGDTAMATNPFELFTAYGIRIKARSKAQQTFVVQLTDGIISYLPTAQACDAGGYGAIAASIVVGPEGGQQLVEESLKRINAMFK